MTIGRPVDPPGAREVITYTSSGIFTPPPGTDTAHPLMCDVVITAGGGGGGGFSNYAVDVSESGNGGNAGQVAAMTFPVTGPVSVSVGASGIGGAINTPGGAGGLSSFAGIQAIGGPGGLVGGQIQPPTSAMPSSSTGGLGGPSPIGRGMVAVANGNIIKVALAENGDGSWGTPSGTYTGAFTGVAYGLNHWVIISQSNVGYYADGSFSQGLNNSTLPVNHTWRSIAYGNGQFVAVGGTNPTTNAARTTNGATWTPITLPVSQVWRSVIYANGTWLALGTGSQVATSPDAITWTARQLPTTPQNFVTATYGAGLFVIMSNSTVAATSPDGINWTMRTLPSPSTMSVTYGQGKFISVSSTAAYCMYSNDGMNWGALVVPFFSYICIRFANDLFIATTTGATIARSPNGVDWDTNVAFQYNGSYQLGVRPYIAFDENAVTPQTSGIANPPPTGGGAGFPYAPSCGGSGGGYQPIPLSNLSNAPATPGQVFGAGGGGGGGNGLGTGAPGPPGQPGAAGAPGLVTVSYWKRPS